MGQRVRARLAEVRGSQAHGPPAAHGGEVVPVDSLEYIKLHLFTGEMDGI